MNSLVDEKDDGMGHIIVPLMFTQSGTKPMTSIDMSKKYVDFYDALKDADKICSIGFGFNSDDEHINGVIRTLIERENKQLYIVCVDNMSKVNLRKMYARKLRISNENNIHIVQIDSNSRKVKDEDIIWYEKLE